MKKTKHAIFMLLLMYAFVSCDIFDYHPYSGKITGKTNINAKNIERITESCKGLKEFKFAFISDTQRWYDETEDVVKDINSRNDIKFVIHGGDISDFGVTKEFLWQRDILEGLNIPYVCCIGNHDCIGTGEDVFQKVFGVPNFAFTAGNVRFICLNTVALEYDYSNPIPNFKFIENEINSSDSYVEKTIFCMHCRPNDDQFNNNVAKAFEYYVLSCKKPQFCITGHIHRTEIKDLFNDGLMYYACNCIGNREYYIFTIKEDGYEYEVVDY